MGGYHGRPVRDKWAEFLVEIITYGLTLLVFGLQVSAWVAILLVGLRLNQVGKEVL